MTKEVYMEELRKKLKRLPSGYHRSIQHAVSECISGSCLCWYSTYFGGGRSHDHLCILSIDLEILILGGTGIWKKV